MNTQVPGNPEKNREETITPLFIVTAILVTIYLASNVMAVKIISINGISFFDAGTIVFPLAYMLGDVLTELWGFTTAKKVIWLTFLCNVIFVFCTALGLIVPSPEYAQGVTDAYAIIFGYVPRIVIASLIAFLSGELSNSWSFELIKRKTGMQNLWIRSIGSSVIGHLLDTTIFVIIAFAGTAPIKDLISMIVIQYITKLLIEILFGTPLAYAAIRVIKSHMNK